MLHSAAAAAGGEIFLRKIFWPELAGFHGEGLAELLLRAPIRNKLPYRQGGDFLR
jgi:hypothetical protein